VEISSRHAHDALSQRRREPGRLVQPPHALAVPEQRWISVRRPLPHVESLPSPSMKTLWNMPPAATLAGGLDSRSSAE